ncbi:hypothetical protein A3K93_14310 (plasmid) [Acinetobacter sp. NCu2D-2]|uniref:PAS domain-containing protein n=1 Tax=Acinetobacter sp. NCu2D-2 TaxID=1608473 RepID=UPI0007CDA5BF|nr:PAS domain-containing protein [Acinetobacter sp. NCu2D-2]ANF83400.1 hypothetical protein A3K93_14310 [Acinetobacter sp. NCu2D-2]
MLSVRSEIYASQQDVLLDSCWSPVFDQLKEWVILFDENLQILKANVAWRNFDQGRLQALNRYIYPEDLYVCVKEMQSQSTQSVYLRLIHSDQSLRWIDANIQKIEVPDKSSLQKRQLWCLLAREQTEQINARSIKDAQQRMLRGILQRMPMMLYRSRNNRDWTMEYVSEGCKKITGHSEKELINTPLYGQLIHPHDRDDVWHNIQLALEVHQSFHIRYRLMTAQQQTQWVQEIGQGVYSQSGMVLGIDGIVFQTQAEREFIP